MNLCKNACYRLKQGLGFSKRVCTFEQLTSKYSIQQIKEFLKTKAIVINYCGKCEYCLSIKKNQYKKRVQSQLKKSKYSYLITLTLDNDIIPTLITDEQKQLLLNKNISISPLSILSKNALAVILKNWKNKFNRYYDDKVQFHYFACGEYGENTARAHYHILLMLNYPIPHLIKQPVKGNHFKSSFMDSSQYSMYDIEPANMSTNTAGYISKYLSKSTNDDQVNLNRFQDYQIKYYTSNGINPTGFELLQEPKDVKYILMFYLLQDFNLYYWCKLFNWHKIKYKVCNQQRPFIKISRGLGMSDDPKENYLKGVINGYYIDKYKLEYEKNPTKELKEVLDLYTQKRKDNIQKYFYKSKQIINKKTNNNDIL